MVGVCRIVDGIVPVLSREFKEEIFLPLPGGQPGDVDTVGRDAGADLETIVAGPRGIVLEDIAAKIHPGGVETLAIENSLPFEIPPVSRLITDDPNELIEIGAQRMRQRLVVVAVVGDGIVVLEGKGPHDIGLELQIEIFYIEHIDPFETQLQPLFVGPIASPIMKDLMENEFVEKQLAIELGGMANIDLPVQPGVRLIRAPVLLLRGNEKDHRVEIGEIIVVGAAEDDVLKDADGQPRSGVDIQVMEDAVFLGVLIIHTNGVLTNQLLIDGLIVELPDTDIEFQEEIGGAVIAEDQAAIAVANEVLVIAELPVEIFPGIEIDGGAVIVIIKTGGAKGLIIADTGYRIELVDPLLKIGRPSLLVIGKIGGEADLIRDHAPHRHAFGVEIDPFFISRFVALGLLDRRVDGQEKIFVLHLVEISLGLIEGVEPGAFAHKAIPVSRYPFDVIGQQGQKVGAIDGREVVDIVIGIPFVKRVGDMGDAYGQTTADGFGGGDVQVLIRLLQDLHPFQKMIEFRTLGKEAGLGAGPARQEDHRQQRRDDQQKTGKLRHKAS